jgi:hypothetical protein
MVNLSLTSVKGYNLSHLIRLYDLILCPDNIESSSKWLNCDKFIIDIGYCDVPPLSKDG